tara:strand:+ start:1034 stop:1411 length:378 start_codon:yes stop_codon:yes gene_type:complete
LNNTEPNTNMKNHPALPTKWRIDSDFIYDMNDYPRYIKQKDGKIDRMKIALILENHGYEDYAKAWTTTAIEAAAPEMLKALELAESFLSVHVSDGSVGYSQSCHEGNTELLESIRSVIAKAKGAQ